MRITPALLLFATLLLACPVAAQDASQYKFINLKANHLQYDTASPTMQAFFQRWHRVADTRKGNLNIMHIGGSHVQAGYLTQAIRLRLLATIQAPAGPRGMLFPYSAAARCNNPPDYRIHCVEPMILTRCVSKEHAFPLGLCGIAVTATDTNTEIQVVMNEPDASFGTTRVLLLGHSNNGVVPRLRTPDATVCYPSYFDNNTDRYIFNLDAEVDSFAIILPCLKGDTFTVSGICLDNRRPGLTYHSIGVNGAAVPDYLRCPNFVRDLRLVRPDAVVFGIGINDASGTNFDTAAFRLNYLQLIDSVRAVNPDCALIFVTNNDSFRKTGRKYTVNTNGQLAREVFLRLAAETGGAVWDQFEVMGGLRSMDQWRKAKLAKTDRVHFTREGYVLVGNLFSDALIEAYNNSQQP